MKTALTAKLADPGVKVPWTGFDLINVFNGWKKTEAAGRRFVVDSAGTAQVEVTGLAWRGQVCQQVFEEACVDLGKALGAFTASRKGTRAGRRVGFPRFKRKGRCAESFRLRNKHPKGGRPPIRVGDGDRPRSVTLPGIGVVRVHDDTRRLRRLLAKGRGKVLFATVSHRAGRWYVSLNVEAADLTPAARHDRDVVATASFVGVDRGLHDLAVAATTTVPKCCANQPQSTLRRHSPSRDGSPVPSPANREDRRTGRRRQPGSGGTTSRPATADTTSCTR